MPSKRISLLGALSAVVCAATASTASASPSLLKGMYDDANLLTGDPDQNYAILGDLRTGVVRLNLHWGGPDWRTLFVTASTSLYAVDVKVGPRNEPFMRRRAAALTLLRRVATVSSCSACRSAYPVV